MKKKSWSILLFIFFSIIFTLIYLNINPPKQKISDYPIIKPVMDEKPGKFVSILLSRSQFSGLDKCDEECRQVSIFEVAEELEKRGIFASASVNPKLVDINDTGKSLIKYCSWSDLKRLEGEYNWTIVGHGDNKVSITELNESETKNYVCGIREKLNEKGFFDSWSLFAYSIGKTSPAIHKIVGDCFIFGRTYKKNLETSFLVRSVNFGGGACKANSSECTSTESYITTYKLPNDMIKNILYKRENLTILQGYRFVDGRKIRGKTQWDCTSDNSSFHWSNREEITCFKDFLEVIDGIMENVSFTNPKNYAIENRYNISHFVGV